LPTVYALRGKGQKRKEKEKEKEFYGPNNTRKSSKNSNS
jgi:hypothetical protein